MIQTIGRGTAACGVLVLAAVAALAVTAGCSTTVAASPATPAARAVTPVAGAAAVIEPVTGSRLKVRSTDRNVKQIGAADARAQMTRDQPAIPMAGGR